MGPSHRPSASLPFPHACGAASASRKRDSVHDPVEAMAPGVPQGAGDPGRLGPTTEAPSASHASTKSEEHTSELQSLMRISYAVFCLKKKILNKLTTPLSIYKNT